MSILNSISYKRAVIFTFCFIALFGVLLSFQGFDVCDEGLALTVYQQVFNCPSCIEFNFYRWFAAVTGGLWYLIFPDGGIWSFRVLTVLSFLISAYFVFKLFKGYIKPYQIAIGVILSAFISDFGYLVFYHNHLTILLYVLIVFCLHRGILNKRFLNLFFAGFLTVFCILSRLPNITLLALCITFFYPYFSEKDTKEKKQIVFSFFKYYILGITAGILCFLLIAFLLNHQNSLLNSLYSTIGHGTASDGNHNVWALLMKYFESYLIVLISGIKYILIALVFLVSKSVIKNKYLNVAINIIFLLVFLRFFKGQDIFELYFFIFLGNALLLINRNSSLSLKLLSVMALIVALVLPLGSDGALHNMGYVSVWLAMPLAIASLSNADLSFLKKLSFKDYKIEVNKSAVSILFFITLVAYASLKIYKISNEAYFDYGSRLEKIYSINAPLANNIYTTERRSTIINDLLENMSDYVKPDDYLLAYDKIPMIHFLSQTRSYMNTPWVWVYSGKMFEEKLKKAEKEIDILPIVVQQKFETIVAFSEPLDNYMSENGVENNLHSNIRSKAMNNFLSRNNYKEVWSNDYFIIYEPNNKR